MQLEVGKKSAGSDLPAMTPAARIITEYACLVGSRLAFAGIRNHFRYADGRLTAGPLWSAQVTDDWAATSD